MLNSSLCDYRDAYIHVNGTVEISNTRMAAALNDRNKKAIFKNCAPFTDYMSKVNKAQINDDVAMPM